MACLIQTCKLLCFLASVLAMEWLWYGHENTMFKHKGVHKLHLVPDNLIPKVKINLMAILSDLQMYVLDTQVKIGAELSPYPHLVVSWVR